MVISFFLLLADALIQKQIEDEIAKYDADKLGMPDFALESSGETICLIAKQEFTVPIYYFSVYFSGLFIILERKVCLIL
jgi:hypothetical protein